MGAESGACGYFIGGRLQKWILSSSAPVSTTRMKSDSIFFDFNSSLKTSSFCVFHRPAVPNTCLSYYLFLIYVW